MSGSVGQYTQTWFPWVASKSHTTFNGRPNDSTRFGLGVLQATTSQNQQVTWDTYLDSVTWKYAQVFDKDTDLGIYTINLDGSAQGTIDGYNATVANNSFTEITGIAVATPGAKAFQLIMATKNAASSNYSARVESVAWIRTGGTPSVPGGSDTPGFTIELIYWMGEKAKVGTWTRTQSSAPFSGGYVSNAAQNDEVTHDFHVDTGTFSAHFMTAQRNTNRGILTIQFDGIAMTTFDMYGSAADNVFFTNTGLVNTVAKTWTLKSIIATKNASSSDYASLLTSLKLTRTGA